MDRLNKPQRISLNFAVTGTVRGNATENWTLISLLPLHIGESVDKEDMVWRLLMDLKDIAELCFAPKISEIAVGCLASKIRDHKLLYKILKKLKHHFTEHNPELIRKFGPLIHMWTMRFEAKHAHFKTVVLESRCFKNGHATLYDFSIRQHLSTRQDLWLSSSPIVYSTIWSVIQH